MTKAEMTRCLWVLLENSDDEEERATAARELLTMTYIDTSPTLTERSLAS